MSVYVDMYEDPYRRGSFGQAKDVVAIPAMLAGGVAGAAFGGGVGAVCAVVVGGTFFFTQSLAMMPIILGLLAVGALVGGYSAYKAARGEDAQSRAPAKLWPFAPTAALAVVEGPIADAIGLAGFFPGSWALGLICAAALIPTVMVAQWAGRQVGNALNKGCAP